MRNEVIVGEEKTEKFITKKGLRQGCPLNPILFNIYIDDRGKKKGGCIHSEAARYGRGQMGKKVYKGGNKEH